MPDVVDGVMVVDIVGCVSFVASGLTSGVDCGSLRRFCIFWMRERLRASNLLRKTEENVLNLRHCRDVRSVERNMKIVRTAVSSVILRTSFPSDDFHFMT